MQKISPKFKYFLGKAASRKGMGMELALLVLFVIFACSTLLLSSAMLGNENMAQRKDQMLRRIELDQFAEDALANEEDNNEEYDYFWSEDNKILTITDHNGNVLLTVTLDNDKIDKWQYS